MEDMKGLSALSYTSPREAIAEKFHMSEELLEALNPGKKFDQVGETVLVTNVSKNDSKLKVGRIEVDKVRQTAKVFAPSGDLVAFFPATVGSEEKPTPSGTLKVVSADANPNYRYNPDYKFKGVKSKQTFTIKPGPNNPAGFMAMLAISGKPPSTNSRRNDLARLAATRVRWTRRGQGFTSVILWRHETSPRAS